MSSMDYAPVGGEEILSPMTEDPLTTINTNSDVGLTDVESSAGTVGNSTLLERIRQAQQQQQQQQAQPQPQLQAQQQPMMMTYPPMTQMENSGLEVEVDQSTEQAPAPVVPDSYNYASPPMMPPMYSQNQGMGNNTGSGGTDTKEKVMEVLSTVGTAAGKAATMTLVEGKKLWQRISASGNQTESLLNGDENSSSNHHYNPLGQNQEEDHVVATNSMQAPTSQSSYIMSDYFRTFLTDMKSLFMQAPWFVKVAVIFLIWLFFWLLLS